MNKQLKEIRKRCLELAFLGKDANLQSCFSSAEIIWTLYNKVMNWLPSKSNSPDRDFFVLSKGQSSLILTVVLEKLGLFVKDEVDNYCKFGSRFSMQLDYTKFLKEKGIENSAGSLGHGFPMAVGMAYAGIIKNEMNHIYSLAGDGEMNEGTMWEACAFAGAHKLSNLTLIIDDNDSIGRMLDLSSLSKKIESFNFAVFTTSGHDIQKLTQTFELSKNIIDRPKAIICNTQRGFGADTLMKDNSWFHKAPNEEELKKLIKEVDDFEKSDD